MAREPASGQPTTRELADVGQAAGDLPAPRSHVGIVIALIVAVVVCVVLRCTRWGFRLSVVGGNAEAARRAGLQVPMLVLSAMLVGGALAGLAGMIHFAGVEYKLRPGFGAAARLHRRSSRAGWPGTGRCPSLVAAFVFAALAVAGDSLQLDAAAAGRDGQHPDGASS